MTFAPKVDSLAPDPVLKTGQEAGTWITRKPSRLLRRDRYKKKPQLTFNCGLTIDFWLMPNYFF
jgi:hypothetical protein